MDQVSFLLLSCDKYKDLWHDFFCLKDINWPDCKYPWHIVCESEEFEYPNVHVLNCGTGIDWTGRLNVALDYVNTPYICFFLDDFFINAKIDNQLIEDTIKYAIDIEADYYVLGDAFSRKFENPNYLKPHIIKIPSTRKYGIDTSAAIWKTSFLKSLLNNKDCSAWQFELDRLIEAQNNTHKNRLLLYDERKPFNVTDIPVVIQGKFYPKAIKDFKKRGYIIDNSKRQIMTTWEVFKYDLKVKMSQISKGKKFLKLLASKMFGYKFFTK